MHACVCVQLSVRLICIQAHQPTPPPPIMFFVKHSRLLRIKTNVVLLLLVTAGVLLSSYSRGVTAELQLGCYCWVTAGVLLQQQMHPPGVKAGAGVPLERFNVSPLRNSVLMEPIPSLKMDVWEPTVPITSAAIPRAWGGMYQGCRKIRSPLLKVQNYQRFPPASLAPVKLCLSDVSMLCQVRGILPC